MVLRHSDKLPAWLQTPPRIRGFSALRLEPTDPDGYWHNKWHCLYTLRMKALEIMELSKNSENRDTDDFPVGCASFLIAAFAVSLIIFQESILARVSTVVIALLFLLLLRALFAKASIKRARIAAIAKGLEAQEKLLAESGLSPQDFWLTDITYSQKSIPKRDGTLRQLHIPNVDLMAVQRSLLKTLTNSDIDGVLFRTQKLVHPCANAFVPGRSTLTNARPHIGCHVLIKLDIEDFFPSISAMHVQRCLRSFLHIEVNDSVLDRITELLTYNGQLPQGAPCSPMISNLALRNFDAALSKALFPIGARYTRYADDISISLTRENQAFTGKIIATVRSLLDEYGFVMKEEKTQVLRPHQAQRICGITINSGKTTVSRQQRRLLRAAKHRRKIRNEASLSDNQIRGWDAYISSVMDS